MTAWYNENDPYAAAWVRNLIAAGHLPAGYVDERSIADVRPDDLRGYSQCHFFAGIGGWPYALRLAGWPDDRPVWTGSCPCQPFSAAGKRKGKADERHLWPEFFRLIKECRPPTIFGEQVAGSGVVGRARSSISTEVSAAESGARSDATRSHARAQEELAFRFGPISTGSSESYRRRLMRDFWPSVQPRWWKDMGQSLVRPDRAGRRLHLQQRASGFACGEQRNGRLGRRQDAPDRPCDHGSPASRIERAFRTARAEIDGQVGGLWFPGVRLDLESIGYRVGACDVPAAGVGAPHIRQRLWWVADAQRHKWERQKPRCGTTGRMGWEFKSVPWDRPWASALSELRVVDDGLPRSVAATDAARNAIVPQVAATFIAAVMECRP